MDKYFADQIRKAALGSPIAAAIMLQNVRAFERMGFERLLPPSEPTKPEPGVAEVPTGKKPEAPAGTRSEVEVLPEREQRVLDEIKGGHYPTAKEISKAMAVKYNVVLPGGDHIRQVVHLLKHERHLPIRTRKGGGYYINSSAPKPSGVTRGLLPR